jgi:hypothetical protein
MGYRTTYQNLVQGKAAEYQQLMDSINAVYKVADKRNLHYSILLIRGHLFSIYGYYYRLNYMNHFTTAQGKGSLAKDLDVLVNWVINGLEINMMAIKDKDEFENERTSHRYLGLCRMFATVFEMHIQPCLVQLHGPIDSGGQYAKLITALDDCLEHLEWVATAMYYAEHMRKMREIVAIIERSSSLFRVLEYSAAR